MTGLVDTLKSEWTLAQSGAMSRVPFYQQLCFVPKAAILDGTIPFDEQVPTRLRKYPTAAMG